MLGALKKMPAGAIVVLHACCHNPTGVDLTQAQWREVLEVVKARGLVPFLDLAYQGFADGIDADAYAPRLFAEAMQPVFLSSSFSKSFSLYGERVGALSVVAGSADEAARVLSQLKRVVRTNYSNPPTHGSAIVATVLSTPGHCARCGSRNWAACATASRRCARRSSTASTSAFPAADFSFILQQRGMFSYSGLTKEQVLRLRSEYSIYAIETGRICVAALTTKNIDYVADAIAKVIRK